jgi:hypothetical protein
MRVTIDVPDKYVRMCKTVMELNSHKGEFSKKDLKVLESLKGKDVVLDIKKELPENTKELCLSLVMIAWAQEAKKENSEV